MGSPVMKKKIMYFIVENKETGDIWTEKRDYNDMKSRYNDTGWTYEDVMGHNGRILFETISKIALDAKLKEIKKVPLGFKVEENIKLNLEKIAKEKKISLIEVTRMALSEYINKNEGLINHW